MSGTLFVVSTPIGNMRDITFRAVETLRKVDLILCEDTRVTSKLLHRYDISTPLESFFAGNERKRADRACESLASGKSLALVTDAGSPCVSDPGYLLVRKCREKGIDVVPIPGASALTTALSVSGLPGSRVLFLGFSPRRSAERRRFLEGLRDDPSTLVFYEAPHRIRAFLPAAVEILYGRECVICRELTKRFESVGPLEDIEGIPERGEFVVLFGPPAEKEKRPVAPEEAQRLVAELTASGVEEKEALKVVAGKSGMSRREIYRMVKVKKEK